MALPVGLQLPGLPGACIRRVDRTIVYIGVIYGLDYIGVIQRYNMWIIEKKMETTILILEL